MKNNKNVVKIMLDGVKKIGLTTVDSVSRWGLYEPELDLRLSEQLNASESKEK